MRLTEFDLNRLVKKVINENEDTSMDEYINYDIKSVDCQDSSLDDDYWRGSMYVREDEDGNPLVVIRYCKGDDEELNRLKRKARHYMEKSNQLPSDNESIFENKKVVRLTESDLVKIVNRIINETDDDFTSHLRKMVDSSMKSPRFINMAKEYIEPYLSSGCVSYRQTEKYFIINVDAPYCFEDNGFGKFQGRKIKDKLRGLQFQSTGVGEYVKEIFK